MRKRRKGKKDATPLLFALDRKGRRKRLGVVKRKDRWNLYCRILGPEGLPVLRSCYTRDRERAEVVAKSWAIRYERQRANPCPVEDGSIILPLRQEELTW